MDDFFEAYFGESDGEEFSDINLKPQNKVKDTLKFDDGFKVFRISDGIREEY